jgi:hypothetical protein
MGLAPRHVPYLALAEDRLGPISESRIEQLGEAWPNVASPFNTLDQPHLRRMLADKSGPMVT